MVSSVQLLLVWIAVCCICYWSHCGSGPGDPPNLFVLCCVISYSPFLFPFETRHKLFFVTAFDKDRAIIKLQVMIYILQINLVISITFTVLQGMFSGASIPQEQHMDFSGMNAVDGVTPQLEKCKVQDTIPT